MNAKNKTLLGLLLVVSLMAARGIYGEASLDFQANGDEVYRCPASLSRVKTVIGHSEVVYLGDDKTLMFDAKVDSGAKTSSIHATNISTSLKKIKENNQEKELLFVNFDTMDDTGRNIKVEKMVSRIDQVRSASGVSTRYFFRETVWINDISYEIEINLADRSAMTKKMLIGKNLLELGYLIDTTKSYIITRSINSDVKR